MAQESKADDTLCANTIRVLAADTVQKANSGHPGAPMGMAAMAHTLWGKHLRFNGKNPDWIARDRFVLSNGHACALLYSMLHLSGYKLSMDDLKSFRQLGSITPGHPEANHGTPGVEVTTGPLGQGIANAVGLAISEAHLAAVYNKPDFKLFDNFVYVFCGDGCLQEGISAEAASLAGHLKLGKLIVLYDDNKITIDGSTDVSFTEDVLKRFESYGWATSTVKNGNDDFAAIDKAIEAAKAEAKPSIIAVKTIIGIGSKNQGKEKTHGSPLGDEDIANIKKLFGLDPTKKFHVPQEVYDVYQGASQRGAKLEEEWNALFAKYSEKFPKEASELKRRIAGDLPADWESSLPSFKADDAAAATRSLSGKVLNTIAPLMPELLGGSADLTGSVKTALSCTDDFQAGAYHNRYFRFGVREHAMAAIGNGMAAYGAVIPFTATFLNFVEYCLPAVRLSAISRVRQIYIMTHDSIGLGEDGPTHQPIEALNCCRATPGLLTLRPADGNEVVGAYQVALNSKNRPSVIALTRQNLPQLKESSAAAVAKGAYVVLGADEKDPDVVLVGTGSEVSLCVDTAALLKDKKVRVVSMPCVELFNEQPVDYRRSVIPPGSLTFSVETAAVAGWERFSHFQIGMRSYGASAPLKDVMDHFGFTAPKVAKTVSDRLAGLEDQVKALGQTSSKAWPLAMHFD